MLDKVENELQQVRGKSKERIDLLGAQLDQLKTSSEERIDLLLQELKWVLTNLMMDPCLSPDDLFCPALCQPSRHLNVKCLNN